MTLDDAALGRSSGAREPFSVCVFCGSRHGHDPVFAEVAAQLGRGIATAGWRLVYGGGNVGLMGVVADAAIAAGGRVTGIIPRRLLDREVGKREIDDLVVTETMFERKQQMIAASDAFVTLPGGYGTLDELLEVITLKQLGYHGSPILLIDTTGIWRHLLLAFEAIIERGFAEADSRELLQTVPDVRACTDLLATFAARG